MGLDEGVDDQRVEMAATAVDDPGHGLVVGLRGLVAAAADQGVVDIRDRHQGGCSKLCVR